MTNVPEYRIFMGRILANEINYSYFICPACREPITEKQLAKIFGEIGKVGFLYHKMCERVEGH